MESDLMKEEIFGPVMPVIPFKDINEVITHINTNEKPLAVYYFGSKGNPNAMRVCEETSSGNFS